MKLKRSWVPSLIVALLALMTGGWLLQASGSGQDRVFFQRRVLEEVHRIVVDHYVEERDPAELYRMAIDGMLQEMGDPYTVFLGPEDWEDLQLSTTGNYGGLGIRIAQKDEWITIVSVLPNTPAERQGLQTGDRIIEVEGTSAHGWTTTRAVSVLRGPKGSEVTITVARVGLDTPLRFEIERDEVHVVAVKSFMLDEGIGYVRLEQFSRKARQELRKAIDALRRRGAASLVIDLQGNPGGLLEEGVQVADLFLSEGTEVVSTRTRREEESRSYRAPGPEGFPQIPLVILVDGMTASASEIVAGALQDHDRALVLGSKTFGKGSVQSLFNLPGENHLKLTTGRWYTPVGRSIQKPHGRDAQMEQLAARAISMTGEPVAVTVDTAGRKTYRTSAGRVVYGGGGITPDLIVPSDTLTTREGLFRAALVKAGAAMPVVAFRFAVSWAKDHPDLPRDFEVTPRIRSAFYRYLDEQAGVSVDRDLYGDARGFVDWWLAREIANAAFGETARLERTLQRSRQVDRAVALLRRAADQTELFAIAADRREASEASGSEEGRESGSS